MKRKIRWYRSLRFRLPVIIALCCIIPTVIFSYYTRYQLRERVLENARATIYTNLYGSSLLLEQLLGDVAHFGLETAEEKELVDDFRLYREDPAQKEQARSRISLRLGQRLSSNRTLSALYLVWEGGGSILSTLLDRKEISADSDAGQLLLTACREEAREKITWLYQEETEEVGGLLFFRPVDTGDGHKNASLVCQVRRENWEAAFNFTFRSSRVYVCDYYGDVLLGAGEKAEEAAGTDLSGTFPEAFSSKNNYGTYIRKNQEGSWLVMYYNSINNGRKYISCTSLNEILDELNRSPGMPVIMVITGFFSAAAAYFLQNRLFLKPLRELGDHLQRMESGDLTPIDPVRRKDEMGMIQENYNHMITELKRNIDEVYVQQLLRKQAQLNSLQSQIDEHFLYNTLNMIYCEARGEQADKSAHMLWILSRYFRLSLAEGRDKAPLSEIAELMKLYLAIQKARYGEGLEVEMETFPEMDHYVALKYLFQPVVENAIVHGFEKKLGDRHLKIILRREESGEKVLLYYCVQDDGLGMSTEKLAALKEEIRAFEKVEGSGYALKNLREQIRITYGEQYSIDIESEEGKGTKVYFRIPLELRTAKEENNHEE